MQREGGKPLKVEKRFRLQNKVVKIIGMSIQKPRGGRQILDPPLAADTLATPQSILRLEILVICNTYTGTTLLLKAIINY